MKIEKLSVDEPLLGRWLEYSLSIPESQFVRIHEFTPLLFDSLEQSKGATGVFLEKRIDPWRGAKTGEWRAYAATEGGIDLLRNEYVAEGLEVLLLEGRNFVLVRVTPAGQKLGDVQHKRELLASVIRTVVKTTSPDHAWHFRLPDDLESSWDHRLISNANAPALKDLASRHERADILLLNGFIYFVFYKRIEQLEDFLPADKWFGAEVRNTLRKEAH